MPFTYVVLGGGYGNRLFMLASCYGLSKLTQTEMNVLGSTPNHAHNNVVSDNGTFMYLFDRLRESRITCDKRVEDHIVPQQESSHILQFHEELYGFYTDYSSQILNAAHIHPNHHIFLHGYMQNEHYFSKHREQLLKLFSLPKEVKTRGEVPVAGTVAIHVRLGDFKNDNRFFIDLNHYYQQAIAMARARFPVVNFVIICEEPNLVQRYYPNLLLEVNTHMLDKLDELDAFHFMTMCSGVIIANSTFSWWAAWMNETPNKFITLPSRFINDSDVHSTLKMDSQGAIIIPV